MVNPLSGCLSSLSSCFGGGRQQGSVHSGGSDAFEQQLATAGHQGAEAHPMQPVPHSSASGHGQAGAGGGSPATAAQAVAGQEEAGPSFRLPAGAVAVPPKKAINMQLDGLESLVNTPPAHRARFFTPDYMDNEAHKIMSRMDDAASSGQLNFGEYDDLAKNRLMPLKSQIDRERRAAPQENQPEDPVSASQLANNRARAEVARVGVETARPHPAEGRVSPDHAAIEHASNQAAQREGLSGPAAIQNLQGVGRNAATGGLTRPDETAWIDMRHELNNGDSLPEVAARHDVVHPQDVAQLQQAHLPPGDGRLAPDMLRNAQAAIVGNRMNSDGAIDHYNVTNFDDQEVLHRTDQTHFFGFAVDDQGYRLEGGRPGELAIRRN